MSIDHQNIVLVENHSNNKDTNKSTLVVLIFDLYTLDKISEFEVENVSAEYMDEDNSDYSDSEDVPTEQQDLNRPSTSKYSPTADDFPRVICWDSGEYVLS